MIIIRTTNELGNKFDLDLFQNEELKLDISAIESGEIGEVFGVSSQTFALPGTDKNNEFFGNLYDLGTTPATTFTKTVPCQVLYNGAEVFTGKLYLDSVVTNQLGDTIYNIVVVNEIVDFKFLIQDLNISDLDWSEYDHTLNYANVSSSFVNDLFSGDIVYPLVNYGFTPTDINTTEIAAGGGPRQFDNANSALRITSLKPAIKAKAVIDKVFDSVNYKYSSSFLDSSYFDSLYILSTQDDKDGSNFANPVTASFQATKGSPQFISNNTEIKISFTTQVFDNGGHYDIGNSRYTAPTTSAYTFYSQVNFTKSTGAGFAPDFIKLRMKKNGTTDIATTSVNIKTTGGAGLSGIAFIGPFTVNLDASDYVEMYIERDVNTPGSSTLQILPGANTRFEGQGGTTYTGGTVTVNKMFPADTKISDLFKGLIHKFNLVFEPITTERNYFIIEPFDTWADEGQVQDWTTKVDRNFKYEIKHPLQVQPKLIKFSDVEDTDAVNKYHKDKFNKTYGEFVYESDSDLAEGERQIGHFFSPTPQKGIPGAPDMVLPNLSQTANNTSTPFTFKPRLLHNLGLVDTSINLKGVTATGTSNPGYYYIDNNGTPVAWNKYVLFSSLEALPADFNTTRDLHFGNTVSPGHWPYHQPVFNGYAKRSAVYEYWSYYLNEIYDVDARLLKLNIKLDPTEIQNIRLNWKIWIDGQYYRINKITGANLQREASVEVELLKTLPRKLKFPRRRITTFDDVIPVDVTVDDATLSIGGGNVGYVDYNTNSPITSSAIIGKVAPKDGFLPFGSESVWKTKDIDRGPETTLSNFGNNLSDTSVTKAQIYGDGNEIKSGTEQVQILGEGNSIGEYNKFNLITGKNHIIDPSISYATILGGENAYMKGGTIDTGSFNAILNTNEGNILEGRYNTLMGGFGGRIESSSYSTMIGENHYISSSKSTILIDNVSPGFQKYFTNMTESVIIQVGKDMDGADYPVEKLYVGDTYFTEEIAEDFYLYSDAVGTLDLDDSEYSGIYSFILTPSGTGELEVILPPCGNVTDRGYRRKLKFTTQNRSGATFKFSTTGADTFYVEGSPSSYDFNFLGASITLVAAKVGPANVWIIEEQTRGSKINEGAYGSFYSTGSQPIEASGSAQLVNIESTFTSKFTSLSGSGAIEMDYAGAYNVTYTLVVTNDDNQAHYAEFWIKYNGTDYPYSTVEVLMAPKLGGAAKISTQPVTVSLLDVAVNNGDKIELWWRSESTNVSLQYNTFGGTIPASPAVRVVIQEV